MGQPEVALIVGGGAGLGFALARRFARAEMNVAIAARNAERLATLATGCSGITHQCRAYACDATDDEQVETLFRQVDMELGGPNLVVYNAGAFVRKSVLDTSAEEFEHCWRVGCLGGFLVGRAAARRMVARVERGGAGGTIIFTGATASLRGSALFVNLAVGKFGLRALAQSLARELQPKGVHIVHVVIDGVIRPHSEVEHKEVDSLLDPDAIAEAYFQLHRQHRSAWSLEVDLRPWVEKF